MSDFPHDFPEKFPQISRTDSLFPQGSGVQYSKNPRKLWSLVGEGATSSTLLVAFAMIEHCSLTLQYPTFELKSSKIAEKCGLSERQVSTAIKFLTSKQVVSVHYKNGCVNRYTWNDEYFSTTENLSVGPLKKLLPTTENLSVGTTEKIAPLYIEFILELLYNYTYKEFFDSPEEYSFYIPQKRRRKNDEPQGSGSRISVSRKQAWRDAVYHVFDQIRLESNPLTRIYLSLFGPYRLDDVRFPKKALFLRVNNWPAMHEALSNSLIREHLYDDDSLKRYIDHKRGLSESASQKLH